MDIDPSTTSQAEICHGLEIAPGILMCSKGPMCPLECHSLNNKFKTIETGIILYIVSLLKKYIYLFEKKIPRQTVATIMLYQVAVQICEKV